MRPSNIEKIELCRRVNWRLMPWELDEMSVASLKAPFLEYDIYEAFVQEGRDLEKLTDWQLETVGRVRKMMEKAKELNDAKS